MGEIITNPGGVSSLNEAIATVDTRISKSTLSYSNVIDISSYNVPSNTYTIPNDGYIRITGGSLIIGNVTVITNVSGQQSTTFVRKNMSVYVSSVTQAQYIQLT